MSNQRQAGVGKNNEENTSPIKAGKSQGANNRSERANIVQQAKANNGGKFKAKQKRQIEKQAKQQLKLANPEMNNKMLEEKLKEMVRNKGLGKLASKITLRNGQNNNVRASQISLATISE